MLCCKALDSTQHWPTRWGINLKLRAAVDMPNTEQHIVFSCSSSRQECKGDRKRNEERKREGERVLKLCRQLVDEV